ncbi:unnamed protein product [Rotaria magnacalcarata]|uniref:F-box domain-containing protein n=2 Tax=Rotaria magnacalcarata TaxID=392030 RepID=A0A816G6X2_9BILA|nr:unnamed protein product [Rotaria magnacalcarata]
MFSFFFALFLRHAPSSATTSNLELLPNEILFDILSYLSVSDLAYGWLDLNSRFYAIVHSCPIRQIYNEPKWQGRLLRWFPWSYPTDAELLQYFASQVVSLEIHQHLTLSGVNKINILQYPNLRRLTIRRTTTSQVNAIQANNFPYLEYLTLSQTENISFNILCQFKLLRSCDLGSIQIDDQDICSSSSIRSLILQKCDPSKLLHLLHHLPQLILFKVNFIWTETSVQQFDFTVDFVHQNLRSLYVSMFNFQFTKGPIDTDRCAVISTLLATLSPDQRIRCHLSLFGMSNFNFEQFHRALRKLNSCRLSCFLTYCLPWHSLPDFDHIRQLSLFNQLRPGPCNSDDFHTYHLTWTSVH